MSDNSSRINLFTSHYGLFRRVLCLCWKKSSIGGSNCQTKRNCIGYILVSNLSSLIGFESPTSNYSITFAMTFITFILIQYNALKKKGFFKYVWDTVWPPTNILSVLSPLISISMRLFGNILSGSILMTLIYQFTAWISFHVINFNFLGPIIAPVFHCYFDIFAGCIQTLVFVTLSSILIMMENEDDE